MSEPERKETDVHPQALLLPWYLSDTLSAEERAQVTEHLASCTSCRDELESLQDLGPSIRGAFADLSAPSPAALQAVKARIAAGPAPAAAGRTTQTTRYRRESTTLSDRIAAFFQTLLMPKWAPAAAMALIVAQFGFLAWSVQSPPTQEIVTTRGGEKLEVAKTRLRIVFTPTATENDIRAALAEVHAKFVGGPDAKAAYLIEVIGKDPALTKQKLDLLRAHTDLVTSVEEESAQP